VAEFTAEVTAGSAKAEDIGSREHMESRLFLDGIDLDCCGAGMDQIVELTFNIQFVTAETPLAFFQSASAEADSALDYISRKPLIKHRFSERRFFHLFLGLPGEAKKVRV